MGLPKLAFRLHSWKISGDSRGRRGGLKVVSGGIDKGSMDKILIQREGVLSFLSYFVCSCSGRLVMIV